MSQHLDVIRKNLNGSPIRAAGEAMGLAVVVTDDELITGKMKQYGATIERFKLATAARLRLLPNPAANLLQIDFTGPPAHCVTVIYGPEALADFGALITLVARACERRQVRI